MVTFLGRHISYYARSQNTQIFVTPLYVSHEGPSSVFIGVCRIELLYLIHLDVNTSPNPQAGGPPLFGCPPLFIQFIRSYRPYRKPFLHSQTEDAPCRGDRDPLVTWFRCLDNAKKLVSDEIKSRIAEVIDV